MISPNKKPPEIETKTLRLADFSMGLNTTISGSLLNNNELQVAEDVSFEQKGTIMPRRGRRKRYEEAFSDSPCCGLGSYYKKDGTTKLLFASGDKLYSDSPNMSFKWDNQNDWEEPNSEQFNLDSSTTPGDIQIKEATQTAPTPIFTRASVAYLEDGTEVEADKPRFEGGKFGKGVFIEEGTMNLADPAKQSPWTWTERIYDWTCVTSLDLTAGEVVTVSADIRNGDDGSRWCSITGTGVTTHTGYIDATKIRQTYTFTVTETTTHSIYLVPTDTTSYEYRNWQIEKKAYATSFIDGTRISESLKIPTTSLSVTQGTISLWAKNLSASPPNGSVLVDVPDNVGNQGMLCGIADDGKLFIEDAKLQFQSVETSQADFNTGTLSDTVATSAGNLELVKNGTDFNYSETSQSDFNSGTLTDVVATSAGDLELAVVTGTTNLLTANQSSIETDTTGFVTSSGGLNLGSTISRVTDEHWHGSACLRVITNTASSSEGVQTSAISALANTKYTGSLYVKAASGTKLQFAIWDATNGIAENTPITCDGTWQRVVATLTTGNNAVANLNILIRTPSATAATFYIDGLQVEQKTNVSAWTLGGTTSANYYKTLGTRIKEVDISGSDPTGGTKIEWVKTTPTGTALKVETALSTDGGSTYGAYQEATSGSSIPGITAQTDLTNARLKIKETLSTTDTSITPKLHSLSVYIYAPYKSSGYRYKEYDISAVGSVGSSKITWTENKPASTTLTVKAAISTDGGTTYGSFQNCTSGSAIPGLTQGMDISNARLKVQEDLGTSDGTVTPQLQELTIDVGSNVQTVYGPNKSTLTAWDLISLAWKSDRLSLVVNDSEACYIENPELPTEFGSYLFIGTDRNGANAINTIVDELRIDNIARTDAEIAEWYNANKPLIPDEYTTYLSHFDNSLSSEKLVPYAYWESAPKDVSQASNKASGKAVITQTLNSGQVALYSASSPTSSGTYSDWALALPDGTLQHPPDNFVKTKLKLTDTYPYTVLLMHMDGSDNGTTFTDECGKTVTVHGDVVTKTGISKFGTASAYFNNNGEYLSLEHSEDFNFGSSDFTIDFWIYPTVDITDTNIFSNYYTKSNYSLSIWGNEFYCSSNGSTWDICDAASLGTIPLNKWTHIAIVRYGTSLKVYVDGTAVISVTTTASIHNSTEPIFIGGRVDDEFTFTMTGYIDEFRISKGIARWTSDFTPPTSQYVLNSGPVVHGLTVAFDGAPSATPILDDMSFGAEYMFTTLKDILVIANGQNAPYKWDGIGTPTLLGGNPPVLDFITTHNNRVWGVDAADKSRVRFSDILDPETWSVLNFIDFNPDDGDYITAMVRIGQDLIVSKQWSMALLTGNATTNYSVVWLDAEQGVTGKRALCNTNKYFTYVAQDGIRFTDFNTHAVASERLLPDWEKINKRRLNQAAMVYWRNYLLVALPRDNSLYNNTVWAYDMLRNAWSIINGWNVSNWLIFKQYGEEVLLAADSTTGQVYEVMRYSRYDDTEPVAYSVRTKDFTFNAPERYKLFRNINLDLEATAVESPLTVDLIVDGEKVGEYSTIVPADDQAKIHRMILPPLYNAVIGRSLSLALRGRCGIQGIALTYSFGGIVPDEEV